MRTVLVLLLSAAIFISTAVAEELQLAVGQVWQIENPPSPETRVIIGKIDQIDGSTIVHVQVRGLPDLARDPAIIAEMASHERVVSHISSPGSGRRGRRFEVSGESEGGIVSFTAGRGPDQFECHYVLTPSPDNKNTRLRIRFMPVEYAALAGSLTNLESSNEEIDAYFERAWDRWEYLREPFEGDYREFTTAKKPMSETLELVRKSANSTINLLERIGPEMIKSMQELKKQQQK